MLTKSVMLAEFIGDDYMKHGALQEVKEKFMVRQCKILGHRALRDPAHASTNSGFPFICPTCLFSATPAVPSANE